MAKKGVKSVEEQLADAHAQLATVNRFLERVQAFSDVMVEARGELADLQEEEATIKAQLTDVRDKIRFTKDQIETASNGILAILEPGPMEFMPLFDQMEKPSVSKHGQGAAKWRKDPITVLKLSPMSTAMLYEKELFFIGQLQDVILADPENWWEKVDGLTKPLAAAIADKLQAFVDNGGVS